jgi:hypothetical protein
MNNDSEKVTTSYKTNKYNNKILLNNFFILSFVLPERYKNDAAL